MATLNILVFGDTVGKPGRKALQQRLPELKKKYKPDLTLMQAENLAHGYGVTKKTLQAMMDAGIDFFTGGNHVFSNKADLEEIFHTFPIIRPANYPTDTVGDGHKLIEVGAYKVLLVNLMGRVFFGEALDDPFRALDDILAQYQNQKINAVVVDFHAEATSEKKCLGYYADGRASLLYGSHTHVQTADEMILPEGTGYITDVGMVGIKHSSLGMDLENILQNFLHQTSEPKIIPDHGLCIINGIFAKINVETGKTVHIERVLSEAEV